MAVVDGTGSSEEVAEFAGHAAYVAACVAVRRDSPMLGVLACRELVDDPLSGLPTPDGAIVVAVAEVGQPWSVAWAGDCMAYTWDGVHTQRLTTPHTLGEKLRISGAQETTVRHDHMLRHSIARATVGSVEIAQSDAPTLVLASDGLQVPESGLEEILSQGAGAFDCAQRLLDASLEITDRDDTTVVVATTAPQP